jgi:hypothetical protein
VQRSNLLVFCYSVQLEKSTKAKALYCNTMTAQRTVIIKLLEKALHLVEVREAYMTRLSDLASSSGLDGRAGCVAGVGRPSAVKQSVNPA